MPFIPTKLNYLPDFEGRDVLYSPLCEDPFQIRLITVHPDEDRSAPLECSLQIVDLLQEPVYDAISYHWGNANDLEQVIVHGTDKGLANCLFKIQVTRNLTAALRESRARATATRKLLCLWTHALCINQLDASERSSQVSVMRYIFTKARSVRVWLEESDELAAGGLLTLVGLSKSYETDACTIDPTHNVLDAVTTGGPLSLVDAVALMPQFDALLNLPYWYRAWVYQEVARSQLTLNIGQLEVRLRDWHALLETLVQWKQTLRKLPSKTEAEHRKFLLRALSDFAELSKQFLLAYTGGIVAEENMYHHPAIGWLTADFAGLEIRTRDPKDLIFAFCRLSPWLRNVKPDYQASVERVFMDATLSILRHGGSWSQPYWRTPVASAHLPSWVIDFTRRHLSPNENNYSSLIESSRRYKASGNSVIRYQCVKEAILHTAGFVFDEIESISAAAPIRYHSQLQGAAGAIFEILLSWARKARSFMDGQDLDATRRSHAIDAFLRTVCIDEVLGKSFRRADYSLIFSLRAYDFPFGAALRDTFDVTPEPPENIGDIVLRHRSIALVAALLCKGQEGRFVITRKHRFSLVPATSAIGDRLAILASGDVPFVLRPVPVDYVGEEAHRIIGTCYVDGVMNGEPVFEQAERLVEQKKGNIQPSTLYRLSRKGAEEERMRAATELAFMADLCLV